MAVPKLFGSYVKFAGSASVAKTDVAFEGPAEPSKSSTDPQQIVVDGKRTTIWNIGHSFFQIEGAPACTYWLLPHEESGGAVGLTLSCPQAVGGLDARMIRCLKQ